MIWLWPKPRRLKHTVNAMPPTLAWLILPGSVLALNWPSRPLSCASESFLKMGIPMVERLKKAKSHKDIRYRNHQSEVIEKRDKEIAALKAERDELLGYNVYAVGECNKLRAALEEILQANKGWDWEEIASQHWDTARRALEGK